MTKPQLQKVLKILERIKDPDAHINEAILFVKTDLNRFEKMRGQLRDQYDDSRFGY